MIQRSELAALLSPCCEIDAIPLAACTPDEQKAMRGMLTECRTVLVLAHHVQSSLEWAWFPLESERNAVTCAADLHIKAESAKCEALLARHRHRSMLVPYPGRCGLRFKDVAHRTGLGAIGDNYMFLHRKWGPWAHLRVLLTDAEIGGGLPPCGEVCAHCGICADACPAGAIRADGLLGVECDDYQDAKSAEADIAGYIYKCERCARACPVGSAPEEILLSKVRAH